MRKNRKTMKKEKMKKTKKDLRIYAAVAVKQINPGLCFYLFKLVTNWFEMLVD